MTRFRANLTLAWDVLAESARGRFLWIYLALASAVTLVCALGIGLETVGERTSLLFLGTELNRSGDIAQIARPALLLTFYNFALVMSSWGFVGVVLGLFATCGSVSDAFAPGQAELILPRPISRGEVVLARFAGGLGFAMVCVGWPCLLAFLVAGIKHGVWWPEFLLVAPALLIKFAVLLSICTLVTVWAQNRMFGLAAAMFSWLGSFLLNSLQSRLLATKTDSSSAFGELGAQVTWAQRLLPQISDHDVYAHHFAAQPMEVSSDLRLLGVQAVVWIVGPLLLTIWLCSRRDA